VSLVKANTTFFGYMLKGFHPLYIAVVVYGIIFPLQVEHRIVQTLKACVCHYLDSLFGTEKYGAIVKLSRKYQSLYTFLN